jgi:hypothetical protein
MDTNNKMPGKYQFLGLRMVLGKYSNDKSSGCKMEES